MAKPKTPLFPTGRNKHSGDFLMIPGHVFRSEAFRSLRAGPRAMLLEVISRFNGFNNGRIALGAREAGNAVNVNKGTANRYLSELAEHGLIAPVRPGGFNIKDPTSRRATEWRLTWLPCDNRSPTKEFMKFQENTVRNKGSNGTEKLKRGRISAK